VITRGYGVGGGAGGTAVFLDLGELRLEDAEMIELVAGDELELIGDDDEIGLDEGGTIELESGDDLEVGCE